MKLLGNPQVITKNLQAKTNNHDLKEEENISKLQESSYRGPDINLQNLNWRTINGPFVSVWLHNVPWGSEDAKAAPDAKVGTFVFSD